MITSLSGLVTNCYYCLEEGVTYAKNLSLSCQDTCIGPLATQAVKTVDRCGDGWGDGFYVLFVDGVSVLKGSQQRGRYECSWVGIEDAPCSVASQTFFVASRVDNRPSSHSKAVISIELDWRKGRDTRGRFSAAVALLAWPSVSMETNHHPPQQHTGRLIAPFRVYEPRCGRERAPADTAWLSFNKSIDEGLVLAADYRVAWGEYALILHELSISQQGWLGGRVRAWDGVAHTYKLAAGTVAVGTRSAIANFTINHSSSNSQPMPVVGEIELILSIYSLEMTDVEPAPGTVQVYRIEGPPLVEGFLTDSNLVQNEQYLSPVEATKRDYVTVADYSTFTQLTPELKRRFEYTLYAGAYETLMLRVNCWPYWNGGIIVLDRADDRINHLLVYKPVACKNHSFVDRRLEQPLMPLPFRTPRRLQTPNETTPGDSSSNPPSMTTRTGSKSATVASDSQTHQEQTEASSEELSRRGLGDLSVAIVIAIVFIGVMVSYCRALCVESNDAQQAFTALCIATFLLVRFVRSAHSTRERRRGRRNGRAHIFDPMIAQGHDDDPLDDARLVDFEEEDDESAKESTFTVYRDNPTSPRITSRSEIELADWRDHSGNDARRDLLRTPASVELVSLSPSSPKKRGTSATRGKVEATRTNSARRPRPVTLIELGDYEAENERRHTSAAPIPAAEVPDDDGTYPAPSSNSRQVDSSTKT